MDGVGHRSKSGREARGCGCSGVLGSVPVVEGNHRGTMVGSNRSFLWQPQGIWTGGSKNLECKGDRGTRRELVARLEPKVLLPSIMWFMKYWIKDPRLENYPQQTGCWQHLQNQDSDFKADLREDQRDWNMAEIQCELNLINVEPQDDLRSLWWLIRGRDIFTRVDT